MHTVFALLCFVVVIHWLIFPYPSGLLHWHCGNLTIAPMPAKQPWWIWINTSCEFIMNDCITTTKQSTTRPCAYSWDILYVVRFLCGMVLRDVTWQTHQQWAYWFRSTETQLFTWPWDNLPGPRLNIKTVLSTYGDFHVKDKTAVRTSYL